MLFFEWSVKKSRLTLSGIGMETRSKSYDELLWSAEWDRGACSPTLFNLYNNEQIETLKLVLDKWPAICQEFAEQINL